MLPTPPLEFFNTSGRANLDSSTLVHLKPQCTEYGSGLLISQVSTHTFQTKFVFTQLMITYVSLFLNMIMYDMQSPASYSNTNIKDRTVRRKALYSQL